MNIAIVTVYQPFTNMGSFLQAYALKTYLSNHGHSVCFVKTNSHLKSLLGISCRLRPFRDLLLRQKKMYHSIGDLRRLEFRTIDSILEKKDVDCFIWGSDEIWNLRNPFFRRPLFWGDIGMEIPKLGYAVSIGHAKRQDFEEFKHLSQGIRPFNEIMPRDNNTQSLLDEVYGIQSDKVIDPTLLIERKELSMPIKLPKEKYMLVYTYGVDVNMVKLIRKFAEEHGLLIVSPCFWHIWADRTIECSSLQFSSLMAGAEYVFTTTFHGAVFSLINHTRCCILPLREKVTDLCRTLGCSDRLVSKNCDYKNFADTITRPFNQYEFEANLSCLRQKSAGLLDSALNTIDCNR